MLPHPCFFGIIRIQDFLYEQCKYYVWQKSQAATCTFWRNAELFLQIKLKKMPLTVWGG